MYSKRKIRVEPKKRVKQATFTGQRYRHVCWNWRTRWGVQRQIWSDGHGWFLTTGQTPGDQRGRTGLMVGSFQDNYNSGKNKRRTAVSQVPL
ncbi:hypothetical protein O988_07256 [Pseudogymnoascus sp. VKM F-3808]|nr:hypothetical protein O988_07256 [Pseudogymnoascus sp. VKM F-3808]